MKKVRFFPKNIQLNSQTIDKLKKEIIVKKMSSKVLPHFIKKGDNVSYIKMSESQKIFQKNFLIKNLHK